MEDEDKIIITEEKQIDSVMDRVRNAVISSAAIGFVAIIIGYIFTISESYSSALLFTIGLPSTVTVLLWFILGKRFHLNLFKKVIGFVVPLLILWLFYLFYSHPTSLAEVTSQSFIFVLALLTATITGITALYFNKIIKDKVKVDFLRRSFRLRLLISILTAVVVGLCISFIWSFCGVI